MSVQVHHQPRPADHLPFDRFQPGDTLSRNPLMDRIFKVFRTGQQCRATLPTIR